MFHSHLTQLGYFYPNDEEGVFLQFPNSTREIIAQQLCHCLLSGMTPHSVLTTNVHIRIIMECVGQSFSLPLTSSKIIESCIELYRRWILDEKSKPQPIKDDEQFFIKEIIKQLSVVFIKRQYEENIVEFVKDSKSSSKIETKHIDCTNIHVHLCTQVLDIYRLLARQYEKTMLTETWNVFLKTIMAIADSMLSELPNTSPVTEILKSNLLNLLFEVWIRGERSEEMWEKLTDLTRRWKHRKEIYTEWSSTLSSINDRMIQLLYMPHSSNRGKGINFRQYNGDLIHIKIRNREIANTWYRMLHLLGHFEGSISNAENYFEAISGIAKIARSFIDHKCDSTYNYSIPDGNVILKLCGGWLLEAINHYQNGFNRGKEVALEVLCSLLMSRPLCDFDQNYLAYFYKGIEKALNTRHLCFVSVILLSSSKLFQLQFKGSLYLIPSYISSIQQILFIDSEEKMKEIKKTIGGNMEDLHKATVDILSSLFCLGNHFKSTPFTSPSTRPSFFTINAPLSTFNHLNNHISDMIIEGIKTISNIETLRKFLSLGLCYLFEVIDIPEQKHFAEKLVNLILEKLLTGKWDQQNIITSFVILSNISSIYHLLGDSKNVVARSIVHKICKFIELYKFYSLTIVQYNDDVFIHALSCILQWILVDQWIINDRDCLKLFLEVIEVIIQSDSPSATSASFSSPSPSPSPSSAVNSSLSSHHPMYHSISSTSYREQILQSNNVNNNLDQDKKKYISEKIRLSAEYVFILFIHFLGNFPFQSGDPTSLSSLHSETSLLEKYGLDEKSITSYSYDNKFINLIRFPRNDGKCEVIIVVRDGVAKYVWKSKLNHFQEPVAESPSIPYLNLPASRSCGPSIGDKEKLISQINARMPSQERELNDQIMSHMTTYINSESSILSTKRDDWEKAKKREIIDNNSVSDLSTARLFLTTWGINDLSYIPDFTPLPINYARFSEHISSFNALDQSKIRECFSAAVLYFQPSSSSKYVIGNHSKLSKDYQDFIAKIGWEVKLGSHVGYNSGLSTAISFTAPYFADIQSELIFRVSTMSHNREAFTSLINDNSIYISWMEGDITKYSPKFINNRFVANIVISPLPNCLYRVKLFLNSVINRGPLLDEMIVSKQILSHTVRLTVLNIARGLSSSFGKPLYVRKALIDLKINTKTEDSLIWFRKTYLSQFFHK